MNRNENEGKHIRYQMCLAIFIILAFVLIIIPLQKMQGDREKKFDSELWKPWLNLKNTQVRTIKLRPVYVTGYVTISDTVIIKDRYLIDSIKENMNKKRITEEDNPGSHWASSKRIHLIADTTSGTFSFLLFFNDHFSSVEYQIMEQGGSYFNTVGYGWKSAELCRIFNKYIQNNKNINWVESKTKK